MPFRPLGQKVRDVDNTPASPIFSCWNLDSVNGPARRQPAFARLSLQEVLS